MGRQTSQTEGNDTEPEQLSALLPSPIVEGLRVETHQRGISGFNISKLKMDR